MIFFFLNIEEQIRLDNNLLV